MWENIDKINTTLRTSPQYIDDKFLEQLFKEALEISTSAEFSNAIEKLREDAFNSDSYLILEEYVQRCLPAIKVEIMGESNNIGINANIFMVKSTPNSPAYRFFSLAKDGFYTGQDDYCNMGTADFPVWIEAYSSFQGHFIKERAENYIKKWKTVQAEQSGFYKVVADKTIHCLEVENNQ
jgi:hypothetical protein